MAELNLMQIEDTLNTEFQGEERKLIFWYDAEGEFVEDVDNLSLTKAKVYHLCPDNQFRTKIFLEKEDTETSYLIYAPFARPDVRDNHLEDTILYSKEFFADRASLLMLDLGIEDRYKPVIQKYIKFFGEKKRRQAFYELHIDTYNRSTIEVGLMAVLCKCKIPSFEEVLRCVLSSCELEENSLMTELGKFGLVEAFWKHCEVLFGYADAEPTLEKLVMTLFVTYAAKYISSDLPRAWAPYASFKSGSVAAFLGNLMHNSLYSACFDTLSEKMRVSLNASQQLAGVPLETLTECDLFPDVDELILKWMTERLLDENVNAQLNGKGIAELCRERSKTHFGSSFGTAYAVMMNAQQLLTPGLFAPADNIQDLVKQYTRSTYKADRWYRDFYTNFDRLEDSSPYEGLRALVERVYTNDYLNGIIANFSSCYTELEGNVDLPKQRRFYTLKVHPVRERLVVIISDALRYEVGMELFERLQADEKCTATISVMQSMLPSITSMGMAALLPNRRIDWNDGKVLVDGKATDTLPSREEILQTEKANSRAVQYDDIRGMKQEELREIFTGMDVVYVYHNQIDARGDKANTENEVFNACAEAIQEIHALIRRLTSVANTTRFIVTADHGFLYKRDKLTESDKISGIPNASKRYAVTEQQVSCLGVGGVKLKNITGMDTALNVYYPMASDLFKAPGAGLNYVHGGCSPQEMLVPMIEVKTEKARREVSNAVITLISLTTRITNLITSLDFMQQEPVSDVVKETVYRVYFVDENGTKISSENLYTADCKEKDSTKRVFKLRFSFKNQRYDRLKKYYLVAVDDHTGMETLRHEVVIDIAFADDFGFSF